MSAARHTATTDMRLERAVTVNRPAEELYAFWRQMENLALFMDDVESVRPLDERHYRWTTLSSDGRRQEWDSEILEEDGRRLSWASAGDSEISAWGSVRFQSAPGSRGTEVYLDFRFQPGSSSRLTELFWNLFGENPGARIQQSLRRFQQLMETGEMARTE